MEKANSLHSLISCCFCPAGTGRPSSTQGVYSGYEAGASPLASFSPSTPQATPLTTTQASSSISRITKSSSPPTTAHPPTWTNTHIRQVLSLSGA